MRGSLFAIAYARMHRREAHVMRATGAVRHTAAPFWHTGGAVVIGLVLFAILGLTMGYTVPGWAAWSALVVPVAFAIVTALLEGLDGSQLLVLFLALVITAGAVLAGKLLDRQFSDERAS
jgi:hypothetical protein